MPSVSVIVAAPQPAEILAAREAAGHSQADAAALVGLADRRAWWRYESGTYVMPAGIWALYLLATGQHPAMTITPRG